MKNLSSKGKVLFMAQAGAIAAIYVVMTIFINQFNLANGAIQFRISEALCVLPYFTPAAIPGLTIGCLLSNILTGAAIWDVIFGTLATLIGAVFSYLLRKNKILVTLPPVIANAIIIPFVLYFGYGFKSAWVVNGMDLSIPFYIATVGAGEIIAVCILGGILLRALIPVSKHIFPKDEQ